MTTSNKAGPAKARQRTDPIHAGFLEWARAALVPLATVDPEAQGRDLEQLGVMLGDATVVALGEGVHGGAEPLQFRNRLLRYLVEEKAFTAIAIESGVIEGRCVHDYVRGGPGQLDTVLKGGITWTFDELPQNRELVRWLREYNAGRPGERKVNFYGFDVPGSPANPGAHRGLDTALVEALRYLAGVDRAAAAAFHIRVGMLLRSMRLDIRAPTDSPGYERLSQTQRDALTGAIADLITLLERQEAKYINASTAEEFDWAHRAAIGARQTDAWLRQVPVGWRALPTGESVPADHMTFIAAASDVRDRAQADNLDWILEREGPCGKVLVFAHRYHVSAVPVRTSLWPHGEERPHEVAGTYLRRRLGHRLLTIGNVVGKGSVRCAGYQQTFDAAARDSIDGAAAAVGVPLYLLDTRAAPVRVRSWLNQEHTLGHGPPVFTIAPGAAFDVLLHVDTVTPACSP